MARYAVILVKAKSLTIHGIWPRTSSEHNTLDEAVTAGDVFDADYEVVVRDRLWGQQIPLAEARTKAIKRLVVDV